MKYLGKNKFFLMFLVVMFISVFSTSVAFAADTVELKSVNNTINNLVTLDKPFEANVPGTANFDTEGDITPFIERNTIGMKQIIVYPVFYEIANNRFVYDPEVYRGAIYSSISQFNSYTIPTDFYNWVTQSQFDGLIHAGWRVDPYFLVDSYNPLRIEYARRDESQKTIVKNIFSGDMYNLTYSCLESDFVNQRSISGALYFIRSNGTQGSAGLSCVVDRP